MSIRFEPLLFIALGILCWPGCAAYQFGNDYLFPTNIRTIYVPVAQNQTARHQLGPQLTEALIDEIQRRTPFIVVDHAGADSVLQCTIGHEGKVVLTEASSDDPRALDSAIAVSANWTGRGGMPLFTNAITKQNPNEPTVFTQSVRFVPEAGQSVGAANREAIKKLAQRIVSQMENRW